MNSTEVVGTDGSAHSFAAVQWAAREAARRGLPLRIVHAFDWAWAWASFGDTTELFELAEARPRRSWPTPPRRLVGFVGLQLVHHADCPVPVDRPRPA